MRPSAAVLLAAGLGSRLDPLTRALPKCLMPIGKRPLLDYWLATLRGVGIQRVIVNVHAHTDLVQSYLLRPGYASWVTAALEKDLLGTASTIRQLAPALPQGPVVVAHADNLISCDFAAFVEAHAERTAGTAITMMTFSSPTPTSCGIVEVDDRGVVIHMEEKPVEPASCRANGAVYVFEHEVVRFIAENPDISDISTGVIPHFMGRIQSWHNSDLLRDIGSIDQLSKAQFDSIVPLHGPEDEWQTWYQGSREFSEIQGYLLQ